MDMVGIHFGTLKSVTSISQRKCAYFALERAMQRHGVKITYYSMSSLDQKRGHYKKYGNSWHRKRLEKGFEGIDGLGFCANPEKSNAPSYDWTATANFSWTSKTSLTLLLPMENCDLNGSKYRETIKEFSGLAVWDYGWCTQGDRNKGIAPFTAGDYDDGNLSKEDNECLDLWYVSSYSEPKKRTTHLRDIFQSNFVTETHLEFPVFGKTLREFIQTDKSSKISQLSESLWIWTVDTTSIPRVRKKLQPSGVLLSRPATNSKSSLGWLKNFIS